MRESQFKGMARARIRWLTPDQEGRHSVPQGPIFAATARFASDVSDRDLSIVVRYEGEKPESGAWFEAEIGFLAPELIASRLAPDRRFTILEGPRSIGEGMVVEGLQAAR